MADPLSALRGAAARPDHSWLRLGWLAIVAVSLLTGCVAGPDAGRPRAIAERWIEADPPQLLEPARLLPEVTSQELRFGDAAELARWRPTGLEVVRVAHDAAVIQPTSAAPQLERSVDLDAAAVDVIEFELAGGRSGRVVLSWAGPGQGFSSGREISLPTSQGRGVASKTFAFAVGLDPAWRGSIARLRLQPASSMADRLRLIAVRTMRWSVSDAVLQEISSQPWKVRLGDEVRSALVVAPGAVREQSFELVAGDELRVGYGLPAAATCGARFRVEAVTAAGRTVELLDRRVQAQGLASRWADATLPLDALGPGRVRLRLTVTPAGTPDPVRDLAAWSDPVILRRVATPATNVVMICLDTLRADRMSAYGHTVRTTPRIAAWAAQRAVLFEHTVAPAPWTLPSHVSLFTGLYAPHHGVNHTAAVPAELELLAELMRAAGRRTAAITGGGILSPRYNFTQGFDSFDFWSDESSSRELAAGLGHATRWLDDHADEPFFLFFHTYEVHYPHRRRQPWFDRLYPPSEHRFPAAEIQMRPGEMEDLVFSGDRFVAREPGSDEWRGPLTDDEKALVRAMYDSAVAYADDAVGQLLDHLDARGLRDRTLVVLVSDHGEALGEDDRAGHSYLEDYNLMVPLVLELPGGADGGRRIARQVSLVDVMPTVLDALGIRPSSDLDGRSLLPLIAGHDEAVPSTAVAYAASSNRGLALRVDDHLKYVLNNSAWRSISGAETLYDVTLDPHERASLTPADPRTGALHATAVELLEETEAGIRLTIANATGGVLEGRLAGAWRDQARVKTLAPGTDHLRWEAGKALFELPAASRTTIVVEALRAKEVRLEGALSGPPRIEYRHDIDVTALDARLSLVWTGQDWQRVARPLATGETGFELWRTGPLPAELVESQLEDGTAIDQLRALGYVDTE